MNAFEAILKRKSTREYKSEQISEEALEKILKEMKVENLH